MEKRKGEDGLKIWKRKVIGHGVLGILLSFVIVGNATGIYGADIDDTVPVEAESEMTDSVKEEQQEITQEKHRIQMIRNRRQKNRRRSATKVRKKRIRKRMKQTKYRRQKMGCSIWKTARKR